MIDSYDVEDFENDISLSNDGSGSLKGVESEKYTTENQEDICTKLGELFQKCSTSGNKIRESQKKLPVGRYFDKNEESKP